MDIDTWYVDIDISMDRDINVRIYKDIVIDIRLRGLIGALWEQYGCCPLLNHLNMASWFLIVYDILKLRVQRTQTRGI